MFRLFIHCHIWYKLKHTFKKRQLTTLINVLLFIVIILIIQVFKYVFLFNLIRPDTHGQLYYSPPSKSDVNNNNNKNVVNVLWFLFRWTKLRINMLPGTVLEPVSECFLASLIIGWAAHHVFRYSANQRAGGSMLWWGCCWVENL